jgi:TonB-like protein
MKDVGRTRHAVEPSRYDSATRTGRGNIKVGNHPITARVSAGASRNTVSMVGAVLSVFLHVTLITPAFWGFGSHRPFGLDTSRHAADDEFAMELVAIDEVATTSAAIPTRSSQQLTPVRVTIPFRSWAVDFPEEKPAAAARDNDVDEQLEGRYLGQINARIDRAWLRPRSAIGDERFICQARIEQDGSGNITEVALERCNGTLRWQLSLVHAIQSASPLPAPPDPAAFVRALHMRFEAVAIERAATREQYEPGS